MVFTYLQVLLKKIKSIQSPGEPQEHHLTKKGQATQNFIKDKMTRRVDIFEI